MRAVWCVTVILFAIVGVASTRKIRSQHGGPGGAPYRPQNGYGYGVGPAHGGQNQSGLDIGQLAHTANSILNDVMGYVSDRSYDDAPHLSGKSAFGMLAAYNSPDPILKDSGKIALITEEATRSMAKRLRLTRYDIYHTLPKVPLHNPKLQGICVEFHGEGYSEPTGYKKRNATRRSYGPPAHHSQSYGGGGGGGNDYGGPRCEQSLYRTFDGSCNNLKFPDWGKANTAYSRILLPDYADGVASPRVRCDGTPLPSTRVVSLVVHRPLRHYLEPHTHLLMQWGQFISHDLTFKPDARGKDGSKLECCGDNTHPECLPISIPGDDPFYAKYGVRCMEFVRSVVAKKEGCALGTREQVNQATSYIDASHVYGHSAEKVEELRAFEHGFLKTDERSPYYLPEGTDDECRSHICFAAGDARVNQQPAIMALHTMWMREHNRIAEQLYSINTHWDDERLFQETRKIVMALFQHLTYSEYLPIILGPKFMKDYDLHILQKGYFSGYNDYVDPAVSNVFSVAAYRFGHSMVRSQFSRYSHEHFELPTAPPLWVDFFNSTIILEEYGIDQIVLGLVNQWPYYVDESFTPQLRNHLFEQRGDGWGLDLVAINIQRGREVGLPSYNEWRELCGLGRLYSFQDLRGLMHEETIQKFAKLYGNVDDIDLYAAGVSERPLHGAHIGPTFACLIAKQFRNLRFGDRFWFENSHYPGHFTPYQLNAIRKVTLSRIICDNLYGIYTLQPYALRTPGPGNERVPCDHPSIPSLDLGYWKEDYAPNANYKK